MDGDKEERLWETKKKKFAPGKDINL